MPLCQSCDKDFPLLKVAHCGLCLARFSAQDDGVIKRMLDSPHVKQCDSCGKHGLSELPEWVCPACHPAVSRPLTGAIGRDLTHGDGPTSRKEMPALTATRLSAHRTQHKTNFKDDLSVWPCIKPEVWVNIKGPSGRPKKWSHPLPDIRGEWDWTVQDAFANAWNQLAETWMGTGNGRGEGEMAFGFAITDAQVFRALHNRQGQPSTLDNESFFGWNKKLASFFREFYKGANPMYGRLQDTKGHVIVVRFDVLSPTALPPQSHVLSDSSISSVEPVPKRSRVSSSTASNKSAAPRIAGQAAASALLALHKEPMTLSRAQTAMSSIFPQRQSFTPLVLPKPSSLPSTETIRFVRIYPGYAEDGSIVPVQSDTVEEGSLDIKPFASGAFKAAFTLRVGKKHVWVAKRIHTLNPRVMVNLSKWHTINNKISEAEHYHLAWLEAIKTCCANNYCEIFRTEVVDKKLATPRTREFGTLEDDGAKLGGFEVPQSFVIEERPLNPSQGPRSWLVEKRLSGVQRGAQSNEEIKLFGTQYEAEHLHQASPLPQSLVMELHAWLHWIFATSNNVYFFADIQGFLEMRGFSKRHIEKTYRLFDLILHSYDQNTSLGDKGRPAITVFFRNHDCNDICRGLGLKPFDRHNWLNVISDEAYPRPQELPFWRRGEMTAREWEEEYSQHASEAYWLKSRDGPIMEVFPKLPPPRAEPIVKHLDLGKFFPSPL